ncbi:MAG: hypothetical protein HON90_02060 [Halobacteriovoraceae bacterium]|jgi:hypothetical protein|nr:hypothetical protein [Halobacteriovoraceae bacterium]
MKNDLKKLLTFGFEQTFTIPQWWTDPGFTSTSDTPLKRKKMLDLAEELADELKGRFFESEDIWGHMQYEVTDNTDKTQFYVTMDPGSIEVKTPPCLIDKTHDMAKPLLAAAEKAEVVAYRNWWYGVKAGTEGGCHVNMGGFSDETNPLYLEPELVVKYAAYVHNRPWLHFPFMGVDVGPQGNAMRMDEKEGFDVVQKAFEDYRKLYTENKSLGPQETYDYFAQTNLIAEKASYPSLYKFKTGLFLIEDRGQESLREAQDFYLVSNLRLKILEYLQNQALPESLKSFPLLHQKELTSFNLWDKFKEWSSEINLPANQYERFFERQFPILDQGNNVPKMIQIKDGRRPRVITNIQKRGDVIVSKSIDTSYKRFEFFYEHNEGEIVEIKLEAKGIETVSQLEETNSNNSITSYLYSDLKYDNNDPTIKVTLVVNNNIVEEGSFNPKDMMWC